MGGTGAIRRLRAIDPEVKAQAPSGCASDPILGEPEKCGFSDGVSKSYRLEDLGSALLGVIGTG